MIRRVVLVDELVFLGVEAFDKRPVFATDDFLQLQLIKIVYILVVICSRFFIVRWCLGVGRLILGFGWLYGAFTVATHY